MHHAEHTLQNKVSIRKKAQTNEQMHEFFSPHSHARKHTTHPRTRTHTTFIHTHLLHFARILRAQNNHLAQMEVDANARARAHVLGVLVRGEFTSVINDKVRSAISGELVTSGSNKHILHEQSVYGKGKPIK